jgi:excisionase family DNA binding protein
MAQADDLTTSSVARILEASEAKTRKLADDGVLPCVRTATGVRLFKRADVMRYQRQIADAGRER